MKIVSQDVEMVAYFKKDGNISPIKFRLEEESKYQVIKIGRVICSELTKLCGNKVWTFTCSANIDNIEKIFEIKYFLNDCKWLLYKI